jgi:hypothetical protein
MSCNFSKHIRLKIQKNNQEEWKTHEYVEIKQHVPKLSIGNGRKQRGIKPF